MFPLLLAEACAAEISGRIVSIQDGDTLTILDTNSQQHRIRISGIDAPESKQPFGTRSKQKLAEMAAGEDGRAECHKVDRYKRQVCKVWVQPIDCRSCGRTLDLGYAQISVGMAWWYREYAKEQSAEDRGRYESAEQDARLRKRGIWSMPEPVPPWEWRQRKREKQ